MQAGTLAIAVLSLIMSGLSLGWQAATFVLTGGRVKAELLIGATGGAGLVTIPIATVRNSRGTADLLDGGSSRAGS
jgi:hypothetical protein